MVMGNGDTAQGICHPIVSSLLVFQHELKQGQHTYPPIPSGIKIGCSEDISQRVIVSLYSEWRISKILFEVLCDTPFKGEELELRTMIALLGGHERVTPEHDRVEAPIILFL